MKKHHGPTPRKFACECTVRLLDGPPSFLTPNDDGIVPPLEAVCIREYMETWQPPSSPSESAGRRRLPRLRAASEVQHVFSPHWAIKTNSPAVFVEVMVQFEGHDYADVLLHLFFVARPEEEYTFGATLLVPKQEFVWGERGGTCYNIHFNPYPADSDLAEVTNAIVKREVEDFVAGRRGLHKPGVLFLDTVLEAKINVFGEGAFTDHYDPQKRRHVLTLDEDRLPHMTHEERAAALGHVDVFRKKIQHPRGPSAAFDAEQVRRIFPEVLDICSDILSELRGKPWPCFNRESTAVSFVEAHFDGDREQTAGFGKALREGRRTPSPHALAVRVLAHWTGRSVEHIRRVTRA